MASALMRPTASDGPTAAKRRTPQPPRPRHPACGEVEKLSAREFQLHLTNPELREPDPAPTPSHAKLQAERYDGGHASNPSPIGRQACLHDATAKREHEDEGQK